MNWLKCSKVKKLFCKQSQSWQLNCGDIGVVHGKIFISWEISFVLETCWLNKNICEQITQSLVAAVQLAPINIDHLQTVVLNHVSHSPLWWLYLGLVNGEYCLLRIFQGFALNYDSVLNNIVTCYIMPLQKHDKTWRYEHLSSPISAGTGCFEACVKQLSKYQLWTNCNNCKMTQKVKL